MALRILSYHSADVEKVWDWVPPDIDEVYYQLAVEIGEVGRRGGDLFQLTVATPNGLKWFAKKYGDDLPDRCILIVLEYTWDQVMKKLQHVVEKCSRESWNDSVVCLQRYFHWEFEDLIYT